MILGICIMATEPIPTAYFINASHQSVCICMLLGNGSVKMLPRQRIRATIEKLLDASFSVRSMSYKKKIGDYFFPELLVFKLFRVNLLIINEILSAPQLFFTPCNNHHFPCHCSLSVVFMLTRPSSQTYSCKHRTLDSTSNLTSVYIFVYKQTVMHCMRFFFCIISNL
jgi:hypothetical protein